MQDRERQRRVSHRGPHGRSWSCGHDAEKDPGHDWRRDRAYESVIGWSALVTRKVYVMPMSPPAMGYIHRRSADNLPRDPQVCTEALLGC